MSIKYSEKIIVCYDYSKSYDEMTIYSNNNEIKDNELEYSDFIIDRDDFNDEVLEIFIKHKLIKKEAKYSVRTLVASFELS